VFSAIRDDSGEIVDFRWEFANSAASLITGRSPDDLVGRTLMDVLPDHGPSGMLETYRQIVETGEAYVDSSLWYEDVWGDGQRSRRAFDVRATKIGDGFVVVTREVTQQREQEARLDRQRQDLERSNMEMKLLNPSSGLPRATYLSSAVLTYSARRAARLDTGSRA
jgi:PAS domain-containing protein